MDLPLQLRETLLLNGGHLLEAPLLSLIDRIEQALNENEYLDEECFSEQVILELLAQQRKVSQVLRVLFEYLRVGFVHVLDRLLVEAAQDVVDGGQHAAQVRLLGQGLIDSGTHNVCLIIDDHALLCWLHKVACRSHRFFFEVNACRLKYL